MINAVKSVTQDNVSEYIRGRQFWTGLRRKPHERMKFKSQAAWKMRTQPCENLEEKGPRKGGSKSKGSEGKILASCWKYKGRIKWEGWGAGQELGVDELWQMDKCQIGQGLAGHGDTLSFILRATHEQQLEASMQKNRITFLKYCHV